MDRNCCYSARCVGLLSSLSARRAWIEITVSRCMQCFLFVALRKESVDRNSTYVTRLPRCQVALRKESVDRNVDCNSNFAQKKVALRKESVDRNSTYVTRLPRCQVALRKESVDRNAFQAARNRQREMSLSARRAWIEIPWARIQYYP